MAFNLQKQLAFEPPQIPQIQSPAQPEAPDAPEAPQQWSNNEAQILRDSIQKELSQGRVSIVNVVDQLIELAYVLRASDIHLDPKEDVLQTRIRVDGAMQLEQAFPKSIHSEIISRIKILAGLRTDEHQAAQDGRFSLLLRTGRTIDLRVSIVPTYHGENVVLRLLTDKQAELSLTNLGFSPADEKKILSAMSKPYGMILSTGPTGSGKTTTIYSIMKLLNRPDVSLITIEDPVEYAVEGINQINVNARTGLTFANGLRSILRQDPNIIMVGEIRDEETAGLAVNTALTGHLVLSTIHTNDAATTLPRLLDLKIEPYLIASTINIAIGQRLVRKICEHCKTEKILTPVECISLQEAMPDSNLEQNNVYYVGAGCSKCNNSGYKGRVTISEVLVMDGPIRDAVLRKASATELKQIAHASGMTTMFQDGMDKARAGITTIEEVLRMLHE
jgi:type IV pilus assembly protein PilB